MPDGEELLELARRLRVAGNEVTRVKDRNASAAGLTSGQGDALRYIAANEGCSIADLRARLGASHQAASGIVDRLEAKGFIETGVGGTDARTRTIRTTAAGRSALRTYMDMGIEGNARLFEGLTDEDLRALGGYLDAVIRNLGRERPPSFNGRIP